MNKSVNISKTTKTLIIIISSIIIFQILIFSIVSNIFTGVLNSRRNTELISILNSYIEQKLISINNQAMGYSNWTEISSVIVATKSRKLAPRDVVEYWLEGNADVNDITAIITDDIIQTSGGIEIETYGKILEEPFFKTIYDKVNMKSDTIGRFIVNYQNITFLFIVYPINSDEGVPLGDGIEVFGQILDKDKDIIANYMNAEVNFTGEKSNSGELFIDINDTINQNNNRLLHVLPHINFKRLVGLPIIVTIIVQLIVSFGVLITFFYLMRSIRKLLDDNDDKMNKIKEFIHKGTNIKESFNKTTEFFSNFNRSMFEIINNIKKMKTGFEKIDSDINNQFDKIKILRESYEEISSNVASVVVHVENQSNEIKTQSESVEIINKNIDEIRIKSDSSRDLSKNLDKFALDGGKSVNEEIESIVEVSKYSEKILTLLDIINEISVKTNLLSMNASIEAARAGEYGKGFAVVAKEIRKLADNANKSVKEISSVVKDIINKINKSVDIAKISGKGLENILELSKNNFNTISLLNESLSEQSASSKNVNSSIKNLVSLSSEIASSIKEQEKIIVGNENNIKILNDSAEDVKININSYFSDLNNILSNIDSLRNMATDSKNLLDDLGDVISKLDL